MILKIACRNLFKNKRRTIITIIAISFGYSSVVLFSGFTSYMYEGNKNASIYGRSQGHLTIYKSGYLDNRNINYEKYLIPKSERDQIINHIQQMEEVLLVSPQIRINGLISNGKISTIFIGHGIPPSDVEVFNSHSKLGNLLEIDGIQLTQENEQGIGVAHGLAKMLDLSLGDYIVLFTNTIDGQMNAVNGDVLHLFKTDSSALDDKAIRMPLQLALDLYDTEKVDRLAVLLSGDNYTENVYDKVQKYLQSQNINASVYKWYHLSEWYKKVKDMFDVIFIFIFIIVFLIVVMSIINTMSMAVMERTREIGTLRALGLKKRGVINLFSTEGLLLGTIGSILGIFLSLACITFVNMANITWIPPGVTVRVPIDIHIVPQYMALSFVVILVLCLFSSYWPSKRAANLNIVNALYW